MAIGDEDRADDTARGDDRRPAEGGSRAPSRRRRRALRWTGGTLAVLGVLVLALVAAVWWALGDARGSAWIASRIPGVSVVAPSGALRGTFAAERIEVPLADGGAVRILGPKWRGLSLGRGRDGRWLALRFAAIEADRVHVRPGTAKAPTGEPSRPPPSLRAAFELEVDALAAGALVVGADDDAPPLVRDLRGRLHLGADRGVRHRLDGASAIVAALGGARVDGTLALGTDAPFETRLALLATSPAVTASGPGATPSTASTASTATAAPATAPASAATPGPAVLGDRRWRLALSAAGPLEALSTAVAARVDADGPRAAQRLDAVTLLRPFAAWPLGETRATTAALDLAAFVPGAPTTALAGSAVVRTQGLGEPALATLDLVNADAGAWDRQRLPVRALRAELRARPDDPRTLEIVSLAAELGPGAAPAGRVEGRGRWSAGTWSIDATLDGVQPARLDGRAPAMRVGGTVALAAPRPGTVTVATALAGQLETTRPPSGRSRAVAAGPHGPTRAGARWTARRPAAGLARAAWRGHGEPHRPSRASRPRRAMRGRRSKASSSATPAPHRGERAGRSASPRSTRRSGGPALPAWPRARPVRIASTGAQASTSRCREASARIRWPCGRSCAARRPCSSTGPPFSRACRWRASSASPTATASPAPRSRSTRRATVPASMHRGLPARRPRRRVHGPARAAHGDRRRARGVAAGPGPADASHRHALVDAPALVRLAPLLRTFGGVDPARAAVVGGALRADATVRGRWPALASDGRLVGSDLRLGDDGARRVEASWRVVDPTSDASPLTAQLAVDAATVGGRRIERASVELRGSVAAHRLEAVVDSAALPPEWIETIDLRGPVPGSTESSPGGLFARHGCAGGSGAQGIRRAQPSRRLCRRRLRRRCWAAGRRLARRAARARRTAGRHRRCGAPLDRPRDVRGGVEWAGDALRVALEPGRADVLGAGLRWQRVAWQGAGASGSPARLDAQASLDPIQVAPLLARSQPDFGWGGSLAVAVRLDVRSSPTVRVDAAIERTGGDLTVTDELGTRPLGSRRSVSPSPLTRAPGASHRSWAVAPSASRAAR
jgi:translocation and assembly module TamB